MHQPQDDYYIYYCGQESLRRNGVAIIVNKRVWNAVLGYSLRNDRMISVRFQGKPFNILESKSMPRPVILKKLSWRILGRPTRTSRTNTHKRCPFHYRGLECKSRKSRNSWHNRQIWPWSTEWSRAKANRVLPREHTGHSNTLFQQHKRRLYTWTSPDGQHWNQIVNILYSQRWRSSIQSAKTKPVVDCGSDHELLIAKFRLKLKKVGKTTRPFRYDLNQMSEK